MRESNRMKLDPLDVQMDLVNWSHPILSAVRKIWNQRLRQARPTMIANFAVTYRCNSRCRTCHIWKNKEPERDELGLDEVQDLFSSNSDFLSDVASIQITGGEPFLRGDLPQLVSSIHEQLPRCTYWIPTNGMAPGRIEKETRTMLESLDGHGLGISVSIDGLGRTHDIIRGVVGSFDKAVETLNKLSAIRDENPDFNLSVGMTLTPQNFRELREVFALSRSHGAEFSFRPVNFSDIYYRNVGEDFSMGGATEEMLPTIQEIGRDTVERHGLRASAPTLRYMQGAIDYIRDPRKRRLRCSAGSDSLFLDPHGNVYPCIFLDEKMGNVRERSLEEIWGSGEASTARRRIRNGECPGCWVECETFRDIYKDPKGLVSTALRALLRPETAGIR